MSTSGSTSSAHHDAPRKAGAFSWALVVLFVGVAGLLIVNRCGALRAEPSWLAGVFVVVGFAASIAALAPPLAATNVLMAAGIAGGIGGMAVAISVVTGYPLGPMEFTPTAGPKIVGLVPWWFPLIWASIAVSSRGTARLLLHTQRGHPNHGYQVIAAATGLAIISTILFNLFASQGDRYWKQAMGGTLFLSSGHLLHLVIQVAITALLIDKFPGRPSANFRPLAVWLTLNATLIAALLAK